MSRIGKKPVSIPKGVSVGVDGRTVTVQGPKGSLSLEHRPEVSVAVEDEAVSVGMDESLLGSKKVRALWGTTRSLIQNMVRGVSEGYEKRLEVSGVGWTAQVSGQSLRLNVGYAAPVEVPIPQGVTVAVEKQSITVTGADKQAVGQFSAVVRGKRPPEPYNGKGIKYADERIVRKEGKKFGN